MRAELAKEEAEKAAQAESRKAEIMAGKDLILNRHCHKLENILITFSSNVWWLR